MTINKLWKAIPLHAILTTSGLVDDLYDAGYETAGDILDAEPSDLVRDVKGVGPKRAIDIRQKVFDAVKPATVVIDAHHDIRGHYEVKETTPAFWDTVLTIGAMLAVIIIFTLAGVWLL